SEQNAFATLGGYIFVTEGLLNAVESENALAMVLAHEIAHVKNRDPITMVAGSTTFSLIMAIAFGADAGFFENSVSVVSSSFSRDQEERADKEALFALKNYYGHTFGAEEFFQKILKDEKFSIEFLNSHPDTQKRIDYILQTQKNDTKTKLTPLGKAISDMKTK
ncbi:MAG: M48 family metallopeptidase, partial [Campylobacteraceae bacterium]|nr:M48 family metallopeptidase [Campylobacteraceae bacterium]